MHLMVDNAPDGVSSLTLDLQMPDAGPRPVFIVSSGEILGTRMSFTPISQHHDIGTTIDTSRYEVKLWGQIT